MIQGRKLVGLSHGELAWCSATSWVPRPCQGDPSERTWPVERCKPGWQRAGWPPFPARARESLSAARELFGRGAQCKQTSFHRPRAAPPLARPLPPAWVSSASPWDSFGPARTVIPSRNGARCSQRVPGQGARDVGSSLAVPRASRSVRCRGHGNIFSGVLWSCWRPPGAPQLLGFLPGVLQSWWPCDRVGSIPPGRVTRWGQAGAGTRPPASAPLPEMRKSLCLPTNQCQCQGASCALAEPQCARTRRSWVP